MGFKSLRSAVVQWVARHLHVSIKVREDLGCSHVFLEPLAAVARGEANPR